jgi:hypothetical protein
VLFQGQTAEDQPGSADATFISTCQGMYALLLSTAPGHPVFLQVQVYSKANNNVVWTSDKMIADINTLAFACPAVTSILINYVDALQLTAAQTVFNAVLANYRP